jgi:uncharacterized protein (TIGR00369 family)
MPEFQFTGSNFVAGQWQNGFGLQFESVDGEFRASYRFASHQQGPPGVAHGGALATLLDEAMTAAAFYAAQEPAFTVNLNVSYRAPVFLGTDISISAKVQEIEGRKISIYAEIKSSEGTVTTVASGLFIRLNKGE